MDRRWLALLAVPLSLGGLVYLLAPPVPLTTEADRVRAKLMEQQRIKPEPIPIPPEAALAASKDSTASAAPPAAPRTPAELAQVRALLKQREAALLERKARTPAHDRAGLQVLAAEIVSYNEELLRYEAAAQSILAR